MTQRTADEVMARIDEVQERLHVLRAETGHREAELDRLYTELAEIERNDNDRAG